jgi:membrane-anchored protein YejM (alkaline phosphatase superfamily)
VNLNPVRSYFLVATLLPLIGLSRLARDSNLRSGDILAASGADAVLLLAMIAGFALVSRFCADGSFPERQNRYLHAVLSLIVLALVLVAELLYLRTGEVLDLDIMRFAAANIGDIHGAVGSALGWSDLALVLMVSALAAVILPAFPSRVIRALQVLVLVFPWTVLSAHAAFDAFAFDESPVTAPIGIYQGRYASWNTDHDRWLSGQRTAWARGILTGIVAGKVFTQFELEALENRSVEPPPHSLPSQVSAPTVRHNVLFIVLESIRHDVVGAYQQDSAARKSLTPFIDTLAHQGWKVDRAYTTIPHTSKALVGIYCGTFPRFSPLISESEPGGLPFNCLPRLLASTGYATAHFQTAPAEFENRTGLLNNLGFATQVTQSDFPGGEWQRFGYISMDDRAMVRPAVSWMKEQQASGKPFLASVLTVLTHHPYASPVSNQSVREPADAYESYLEALGYTDKVLAELFTEMGKSGLLENTLVIITGDHGEAFSEHGLITHNGVAFEEGMRVPMILWGKMLGAPRIIGGLRQHLDLMPTVFDLLGVKHKGMFPGVSLLQESGHGQIISSCFYQNYCLNLYEDQGDKTLYFFGKRPPAHYDLKRDSRELADRLNEVPAEMVRSKITTALSMKRQFERLFDAQSERVVSR